MNFTELVVFGINHRAANVELREKASYRKDEISPMLNVLTNSGYLCEAAILSTCNRSEIYVITDGYIEIQKYLKAFLKQSHPKLTESDLSKFYFKQGDEAILHICRVAAGLDSMILGEPQILGQVKDAFKLSQKAGTAQTYLCRLFSTALQTAKRVRFETAITEGAVSIAYAAVELAQKIFKVLNKQKVLLIGAGDTGELVAEYLKERAVEKIYVTNRTWEKAEYLAHKFGGTALPYSQFKETLPQVDLVIGSTASPDFVLGKEDIRKFSGSRSSNPLVMIDIAVPHDFDPQINRLANVFLSDIDSLKQIVQHNLKKREREIPAAQTIINEGLQQYIEWRNSLSVKPTIIDLRKKFEALREDELKKYRTNVKPEEYEKMERLTRGFMNKILHLPMSKLKQYSNGHNKLEGVRRVDVLREIFDLGNKHE